MEYPGIKIEPNGSGIEILLPVRDIGNAKNAGFLAIAFGIFVSVFMAFWTGTPISWGVQLINQGGPVWFGALFMAFGCLGLGGLFFALKLIVFGTVVLRNKTRCSVMVEPNLIVSKEIFGWFSHKHKVNREKVDQLYVVPLGATVKSGMDAQSGNESPKFIKSIFGSKLEHLFAISTSKRDGALIALGYPKEIIESVAHAIAYELNRDQANPVTIVRDHDKASSSQPKMVTVSSLTSEEVRDADYVLPADSKLEIVQEGESVVYRVPERGLLQGSNGLFAFSILWNGFMIIFTSGIIFGMAKGVDWIFVGAAVLFWGVGIGMLVLSIYMAKQSAMIGVQDGLLFIERKTIFGTKWSEFAADNIVSLEMASTNMEVNDVPIMNLRIEPTEGKPVKMLSSLSEDELQWLAQQLRRAIGFDVASK